MQFSIAVSKVSSEGVRPEVDELVAQHPMLRSVSSQASSSSPSRPGRALPTQPRARTEHHVEADQLLDRAVVDRLGYPAAHLGLGLDRRRDRLRALKRLADSAVRRRPTTRPVASAESTKTVS